MSEHEDVHEPTVVATFHGVPNAPNAPEEKGRWRRFLEWAVPRLAQKWRMGEEVLAARVEQEKARARQLNAEASQAEVKLAQDVLRTIRMAHKLEQEKLADVRFPEATPVELEEAMLEILGKV